MQGGVNGRAGESGEPEQTVHTLSLLCGESAVVWVSLSFLFSEHQRPNFLLPIGPPLRSQVYDDRAWCGTCRRGRRQEGKEGTISGTIGDRFKPCNEQG